MARYFGSTVTDLTGTVSPSPACVPPISTETSGVGQATGVPKPVPPVIEPQCPAVSTASGAISVPVQPKAAKVMEATAGYSPGEAS